MNTFQKATNDQLIEARSFAGFHGAKNIVKRCEHEMEARKIPFRRVEGVA